MPELTITEDPEKFREQINRLHEEIRAEEERRKAEYTATGCIPPDRISFEELDLSRFRQEMLTVHKTLQWRGNNYRISKTEARNARLVAIAGICELIKEEYVGKFWDLYERIIGWKNDLTVYDWIWARGFRETGIKMIGDERREFVQTLVMESGIPASRAGDIISFFEIYWRYLRGKDVLDIIHELNSGSLFAGIPREDRKRLKSLTATASEYTRAFALAVNRLSTVFSFIHASDEISGGCIEDWTEPIFRATGINPLTILRGREQLRRLYDRILGIVTPEKLGSILAAKPPGTKVTTPDGSTIRSDQYRNILLGHHVVDGAQFTCLPAPGLDLSTLKSLPVTKVIRHEHMVLLRSFSKITPVMNGSVRTDLVRQLFVDRKDCGHLFCCMKKVATDISLRTADGRIDTFISGKDGFECYPYLHFQSGYGKGRNTLAARVNSIRLASADLKDKEVCFFCDQEKGPLHEGRTDSRGRISCAERSVLLESPEPGDADFTAVEEATGEVITLLDGEARVKLPLAGAMLFSPYSGRQIRPRLSGAPFLFGSRRFVLFSAVTPAENLLHCENFETDTTEIVGKYRSTSLVWKDQSRPSRICVTTQDGQEVTWAFEKCIHFDLYMNRKKDTSPEHVAFRDDQGSRPSDFEFTLKPFPDQALLGKLFWNLIVNESSPLKIPLKDCHPVQTDTGSLHISGADLEAMLHPLWNRKSPVNASVEIALCAMDETLADRRFFVFPDLKVMLPEGIRDGEEFPVQVDFGKQDSKALFLKNPRGRSKVKVRLEYKNDKWRLKRQEFTGKLEPNTLKTSLEIRAFPPLRAVRFGNREKGRAEPAREILRRELGPYDLLVVSDSRVPPEITVNEEKQETKFRCVCEGFWCLKLSELPGVVRNVNPVTVRSSGINESLTVKYRVSLISMAVQKYMLNSTVNGICSFRGPVGSRIELHVTPVFRDRRVGSPIIETLEPSGREINDRPFTMDIHAGDIEDPEHHMLSAVLFDRADKTSGHEYGERWEILPESAVSQENFQHIKQMIIELLENGKPFAAAKHLAAAGKVVPDSEKHWFQETEIKVKNMLVQISLNRVASQVAGVLKKEFLFDVEN